MPPVSDAYMRLGPGFQNEGSLFSSRHAKRECGKESYASGHPQIWGFGGAGDRPFWGHPTTFADQARPAAFVAPRLCYPLRHIARGCMRIWSLADLAGGPLIGHPWRGESSAGIGHERH